MKSTTSPYEPFEGFHPLNAIIDAYIEIWFKDDSDSSSSWDINTIGKIFRLYEWNKDIFTVFQSWFIFL